MLGSFWGLSAPVLGQKSGNSEGKKGASNGASFLPHHLESPMKTLDEMSFKRHFLRGENESILSRLEPALGLGLLSFRPPGLN